VFPLVVDVEVGVEVEVEKELIPVGAFMKELAVTNIAMCAMLSVALALKNNFITYPSFSTDKISHCYASVTPGGWRSLPE
jgi:hypothetical protein